MNVDASLKDFPACRNRDTAQHRHFVAGMLLALAIVLIGPQPADSAQMSGVVLPNTVTVSGRKLVLNGIGLRTVSILAVHIYVAGLYLERPCHNASAILSSTSLKLLQIHFVHNVSVAEVRHAWRTGLIANCISPCRLSPALLSNFLAALQPVSAGENITFIFGTDELIAYENGRLTGSVRNTEFSNLMLASFIGPYPPTPGLKRELLGN